MEQLEAQADAPDWKDFPLLAGLDSHVEHLPGGNHRRCIQPEPREAPWEDKAIDRLKQALQLIVWRVIPVTLRPDDFKVNSYGVEHMGSSTWGRAHGVEHMG